MAGISKTKSRVQELEIDLEIAVRFSPGRSLVAQMRLAGDDLHSRKLPCNVLPAGRLCPPSARAKVRNTNAQDLPEHRDSREFGCCRFFDADRFQGYLDQERMGGNCPPPLSASSPGKYRSPARLRVVRTARLSGRPCRGRLGTRRSGNPGYGFKERKSCIALARGSRQQIKTAHNIWRVQ